MKLLLKQFKSPIVLILLAATVVSMFVGDITDGLIILAIIVPSGLLSYWQEHRANQTMQALLARVQVHVEVLRDGREQTVPLAEVVVGDRVLLRIGDIVPGDLRLESSQSLQLDESALTGESFAAEKVAGDLAFFGTSVAAGTAVGVVEKIGRDTEYGSLAEAIAGKDVATGFERGMTRFGILLMRAMAVLLVGIFTFNLILQRPLLDSLLFSIALAVGLTPQLLPAIISVSLAAGAKAMAKKQVLVKRLDAIEDFGAMNVLCTDKTGTLTRGVVQLDAAIDAAGASSNRVLRLALLNASLQQGFKNPLDEAIIESAKVGNEVGAAVALGEIAYDFERKRLSVLVQDGDSRYLVTKGAFDSVLSVCAVSGAERAAARAIYEQASAKGYRVLAVATGAGSGAGVGEGAGSGSGAGSVAGVVTELVERNLKLEGMLFFMDPLKEGAAEAVAEVRGLGIDLVLITGDNEFVARSIASQVGLNVDRVATGAELAAMSDSDLASLLVTCRVFAGTDPLQKQRIVKALSAGGATVGYFGDGINDAAALHSADVGISVDGAVDIAKHAAAIVLLDKDLSVVAEGVRLGRKTFINTMKYVRVGVSAAFGNMLSMAIASIFLPFLPLLPIQILLLNFLTDFPALAISGDTVDDEAIQKPREWNIRNIRNFMLIFGLISSVFDILTFLILRLGFNAHAELFRSGWFIESTLTELVVMLILRTRRPFWRSRPGSALWVSSMALAATVIVIPFTAVGVALKLDPLGLPLLMTLFGLIVIYAAINEVVKRRLMRD